MLVAIISFLQAWRRYNASLRELNQLGDRELADIGISRSDIPRVAWDSRRAAEVAQRSLTKAPAPCGRFRFSGVTSSASACRSWLDPACIDDRTTSER